MNTDPYIIDWLQTFLRPLAVPLMAVYLVVLAVIVVYGLHRYWLVWLFARRGCGCLRPIPPPRGDDASWPVVTVQLPMFNERHVARRIIEAACALDYPADRLHIQVLDDSTDESAEIARRACEEMRFCGHDVEYLHRADRQGFKAGALAAGLTSAKGEFIAVFDADFVPQPGILKATVWRFDDPRVGMVQTRWGHLNRDDSLLTRSQAIFLDGHFVIEHTARFCSGRWFNFNGTAGVWRKTCIEDAGGWEHDTLTEDVDLSYRAQLNGWKFIYDPSLECPAELPPRVSAFKSQQHRWTKGSIQTGLKLLPTIFRSAAPFATKLEAFFHLTSPVVSVFVVLLSLLFFPAFFVNLVPVESGTWRAALFGLTLFGLATMSAGAFYVASQRAQGRGFWATLVQLPVLMAVGIGISVNNARAVFEALLGVRSPFVRTPKFNGRSTAALDPAGRGRRRRWLPRGWAEMALGALMLVCIGLTVVAGDGMVSVPFLLLFAAGYLTIGMGSLRDQLAGQV